MSGNLKTAQEEYQYNYTYLEPVAMVEKVPKGQGFSFRWLVLVAEELFKILVNAIAGLGDRAEEEMKNEVEKLFRKFLEEHLPEESNKLLGSPKARENLQNLLASLKSDRSEDKIKKELASFFGELLAEKFPEESKNKFPDFPKEIEEVEKFLESLKSEKGEDFIKLFVGKTFQYLQEKSSDQTSIDLEDYNKLFVTIKLPAIANNFQEDETFAYMQVAGPNPLVIQRMTEPDDRIPVSEEQYQEVMGSGDSLEVARQEGRVYLADYAVLAGAINGTYPKYQKYLYAPLAMFAVPKGDGKNRMFKPVAIQCQQQPGPDNPIVTPNSDPNAWLFAKNVVNVADGNFHEAVSHLARTHLFIEPFVIATHRQLPDDHPLSVLLRPHFEGTLAINNAAQASLIAPEGDVNKLLAATIDNSRVLAVKGLQTYPFNQAMLPKELERRGVSDRSLLPVYPYRDDALLIWDAIHQWVSSYLSIYYRSDRQVQQDTALQTWATELIGFNGGRVIDFGEPNGRIQTRDYLIEATTMIIFTSSAQHAAVNFPQSSIMGYAPAMPLAGYAPATDVAGLASEQEYLDLLPPLDQARQQLNLGYLLGSVYYTQLGKYGALHFHNHQVKASLRDFQEQLRDIEKAIGQRNEEATYLPYAYDYLLPSKIPQSINI
ncbi:MAG: lipoxygenase family protein [Hormoscilla sp.]